MNILILFGDSVIMERAREFAGGEPIISRWLDLVRLERVKEVAAERGSQEFPLAKSPTKDDYFMPIPE